MPHRKPTANRISIDSTPNHAVSGIASSAMPRPTSAAMMTGSLRTRSSSTPACRLTSANGSVSSATRMPICIGVALSNSAAVNGSARLVICAPNDVMVSDTQSLRKLAESHRPRKLRRIQRCNRSVLFIVVSSGRGYLARGRRSIATGEKRNAGSCTRIPFPPYPAGTPGQLGSRQRRPRRKAGELRAGGKLSCERARRDRNRGDEGRRRSGHGRSIP